MRGISRRDFIKLQCLAIPQVRQLALAMGASLVSRTLLAAEGSRALSIVQGMTDETTTQLSIVVPSSEILQYNVYGGHGTAPQMTRSRISRTFSDWSIDRLVMTGLLPNCEYVLTVTDSRGEQIDQRIFCSLKADQTRARFATLSCINDKYNSDAVWVSLIDEAPDFILFLGDSTYADHLGKLRISPDPEHLWRRHVETRNRIPLYFSPRLIPILATWDDHDFGGNDSNRTFRYAEESREIFKAFFPQDSAISPRLKNGPGVSSSFQAFGQNFLLLDDRTHRSEKGAQDPTHWGDDQDQWIAQQCQSVNAPTYLFNGSEFFGAYNWGESVEKEHPASLEKLRQTLKGLPQVCLLGSGDVHYSEIMRIEKEWLGYPTLELVSSSIQSLYYSYMDKVIPNKRRVVSAAAHNYMLIESEARPDGSLDLKVASKGSAFHPYFAFETRISK